MKFITTGLINLEYTRLFLSRIRENNGFLSDAALQAHEKEGLNLANSTEENDSWYEAVAQYKEHYGEVTL